MLQRNAIEKILVANGVSATAPDEEIKSILLAAQWVDDDVETALSVLRENEKHEVRHDTINHVFRSDSKLDPNSISQLLGVTLDEEAFSDDRADRNPGHRLTLTQFLSMIAVAVVITAMIAAAVFYHMNLP